MRRSVSILHILGILVVILWMTLMALLIRRTEFSAEPKADGDFTASSIEIQDKEWREIYLKERKVGYTVSLIRPFKAGYFIQEELFLRLNLMGLGRSLYSLTQAQVDENLLLKSFQLSMNSGVVRFRTSGKVEGDVLVLSSGGQSTKRITLSQAPMVASSMSYFFRSRKMQVGDVFPLPFFDPSTLTKKQMLIKVAARETLTLHRVAYETFRLETDFYGKPLKFWVDETGETLKEEGFMGFTTVKSSAARAPQEIEEEFDLYEMAAVVPDRPLKDPAKLTYLKLRLEGAKSENPLLNSGRQRMQEGALEILRERILPPPRYSLGEHDLPPGLKEFLEPEFNIESRDDEIVAATRRIAGDDRDPVSVARKLLQWVYRNVEKRPVLSIPSAVEVLRSRAGDCNEHATLLTALLRAAGIPGRLCIGLVYTRDKFYYHVWTEAHLGEWISMDATLNQMPVDATHIKLLEGNLDKQVEIAGLIGSLKVQILDQRHD
ncbi:MAG: transglutaminase-like domain-containing protein [Deltaproteobacteria bacterium]